jgi:hypothetical protein
MYRGVDGAAPESRLQLCCKQPLAAQFGKRLIEDLVTFCAKSLDDHIKVSPGLEK